MLFLKHSHHATLPCLKISQRVSSVKNRVLKTSKQKPKHDMEETLWFCFHLNYSTSHTNSHPNNCLTAFLMRITFPTFCVFLRVVPIAYYSISLSLYPFPPRKFPLSFQEPHTTAPEKPLAFPGSGDPGLSLSSYQCNTVLYLLVYERVTPRLWALEGRTRIYSY